MQQINVTRKVLGKIIKTFILFRNIFYELFCKCNVVKMSVTFQYNGDLLKSNWGDDINFWFFREIMQDKLLSYDWALLTKWLRKPYISGIGSILTLFDMKNSIVWGSGIISTSANLISRPKKILAVRGPLTRKRLLEQGIECPEVYGDPALLLPRYYTPNVVKRYRLGVIPHYSDYDNKIFKHLNNDTDVLMIDIAHYNHWLDLIDQICSCEVIVSSSLHGLIISEAYSIPNVWMKVGGSVLVDDFKFHDFFLSLGCDRDAYLIETSFSKIEVLEHATNWKKHELNLNPMLEMCPFRIKHNVQITR